MHEKMYPFLNAYLDGELHGARLQDMEQHLADCEHCQEELDELRRLSDLLRTAPVPEFLPDEHFASNLTLSLPRRPQRMQTPRPVRPTWWLVPAGLIGIWFFMQTVYTLTNLFNLANVTGLLGQAIPWLVSSSQEQTAWFALTTNLLGTTMTSGEQSTLALLNGIEVFSGDLIQRLFWQVILILPALCWLAYRWLPSRSNSIKIEKTH